MRDRRFSKSSKNAARMIDFVIQDVVPVDRTGHPSNRTTVHNQKPIDVAFLNSSCLVDEPMDDEGK